MNEKYAQTVQNHNGWLKIYLSAQLIFIIVTRIISYIPIYFVTTISSLNK